MEGIYSAVVALCVLIAVLWIILPFAVFGIKSRLDRTNETLEEIKTELRKARLDGPSVAELIEARRRAGS